MRTPPIPHRTVSQIGMLSLSPGATNFPSRPMMMPAMMTPITSIVGSLPLEPRRVGRDYQPGVPAALHSQSAPRACLLRWSSPLRLLCHRARRALRQHHVSWAAIGSLLGTSGEAARQRNGGLEKRIFPPHLPRLLTTKRAHRPALAGSSDVGGSRPTTPFDQMSANPSGSWGGSQGAFPPVGKRQSRGDGELVDGVEDAESRPQFHEVPLVEAAGATVAAVVPRDPAGRAADVASDHLRVS